MKKLVKFISFVFLFSFAILLGGSKAEAVGEFWEKVKNYQLQEADIEENYIFDKRDEWYNYTFDYDYTIKVNDCIMDQGARVCYLYAFTSERTISYHDLEDQWLLFWDEYDDVFTLYQYDFVTQEFNRVMNSEENEEGSYTITNTGVYKLQTTAEGKETKTTYVFYEKKLYNAEITGIGYDKENREINGILTVQDPRKLEKADLTEMVITAVNGDDVSERRVSISEDEVEIEQNLDQYIISFKYQLQPADLAAIPSVKEGKLTVVIAGNEVVLHGAITYDAIPPVLETNAIYYNEELYNMGYDDLNINIDIYLGDDVYTFSSDGLIVFTVLEDSLITKATFNDQSCTIESIDGTIKHNIYCSLANIDIESRTLMLEITDEYFNTRQAVIDDIIFDNDIVPDGENAESFKIEDLFELTIDGVQYKRPAGDSDDNPKFQTWCAIYGEKVDGKVYSCFPYNELDFHINQYYEGKITVMILDDVLNYATHTFDVTILNGYLAEDFAKQYSGSDQEVRITKEINNLYKVACGTDEACKDESRLTVKYGELVEDLGAKEDKPNVYVLPSYVDILNEKFRDSTCAAESCDKTIEVTLEYKVGNIPQRLNLVYEFEDKLPHLTTGLPSGFEAEIALEYKEFDITADGIKNALWADSLELTLLDHNNNSYKGRIMPVFVEYEDRQGNKKALNNEEYDYIATVDGFGYYLLECRIQLLSITPHNETTPQVYEEPVFGKSFFVRVELRDTIIPMLTLVGDSTVSIKQRDVYKDVGVSCVDHSVCNVEIAYYFNNEDNPVEGIDTNNPGLYIIKYLGVDAEGNCSLAVRREVTVVSLDSFDKNTIIIVSAIVGAFVIFSIIAIVVEVKKTRRRKIGNVEE